MRQLCTGNKPATKSPYDIALHTIAQIMTSLTIIINYNPGIINALINCLTLKPYANELYINNILLS